MQYFPQTTKPSIIDLFVKNVYIIFTTFLRYLVSKVKYILSTSNRN